MSNGEIKSLLIRLIHLNKQCSETIRSIPRTLFLLFLFVQSVSSQFHSPVQHKLQDEETVVNDISGSAAGTKPIIIPFGASSLAILWEDMRNAEKLYQHTVFAQRLFFPQKRGLNIPLTPIDGYAVFPDASLHAASKQIVLSWQEYVPGLMYTNIYSRLVDSTCTILQNIIIASRDSVSFPVRPRVAVNDSIHILTWQQNVEKQNVMFRSFDNNFIPKSDTMRQNVDASLAAMFPALAMTADGFVQSVWIDKGFVKRSIMTQRNYSNGKHIRSNVRLSEIDSDLQLSQPEIIPLPDGQTLCAWTDARTGDWNVYVQFVDQDGLKFDKNILISTNLPAEILADVSLGADAEGNVLIAWESKRNKNITLAGQWITSEGKFIGRNFNLINEGTFDSRKPAVRCEAHSAYVAWLDNRFTDSPAMFDVFVKRIDDPTVTGAADISSDRYDFYLGQNYPNPFSGLTIVDYRLSDGLLSETVEQMQKASLKIYDVLGHEVLDLSKDVIGRSSSVIRNTQLPSNGIYFYRLTIGNKSQTRIMTLLK